MSANGAFDWVRASRSVGWTIPQQPTEADKFIGYMMLGCLQRIADAVERDRDRYELLDIQKKLMGMSRQIRALERANRPSKEAPDTSLMDCEFSIRTRKALQRLNLETVRDLVRCTPDELLEQRNFGTSSLHEVKQFLAGLGFSLHEDGGAIP